MIMQNSWFRSTQPSSRGGERQLVPAKLSQILGVSRQLNCRSHRCLNRGAGGNQLVDCLIIKTRLSENLAAVLPE